jgi:hypothetical protein
MQITKAKIQIKVSPDLAGCLCGNRRGRLLFLRIYPRKALGMNSRVEKQTLHVFR